MGHKSMMQRWIDLFPGVSLDESLYWYRWVKGHYDAIGRYYHNWEHPEFLFHMMDLYFPGAPRQVLMAIFLHDLCVEPGGLFDEEDSAILSRYVLSHLAVSIQDIEMVAEIIVATKHHHPTSWQAKIVCDLDLCALGYSAEIFDENSNKIKKENDIFTELQRRMGRNAFIDSMLARPRIFSTQLFYEVFELDARANLITDREKW